MRINGWSVLSWLVWGLTALYAVMTVGIWHATLTTLGLSSLRRCPRMLRLSFRASPIRELSVVLILTPVGIFLMSRYGIGGGYVTPLPLLLIALLCFTLVLVPPTTLVFSSSTDGQLRWALELKKFTGGRRVISLLDTGYMAFKPSIYDLWPIISRRSASLTDVLRTSDAVNWQDGVRELIDISPIIVVDTRVCTEALLFEASAVLTPEHVHKAILVSADDGACPVLERLLDEGHLPSGLLVNVVKAGELGQLLQQLVASGDTLPRPGSLVSSPLPIRESAARRDLKGQTVKSSVSTALGVHHPPRVYWPDGRKRLSTALTPFWLLLAGCLVVHLFPSVVWGLWTLLTLPESPSTGFKRLVLLVLLSCNWVGSALYFYLARSLKKVYLYGDNLLVSNYRREHTIHLSQISRVSGPDWTTLRRITLHLHHPSPFGNKIIFAGRLFSAGRIARDLRRWLASHAEEKGGEVTVAAGAGAPPVRALPGGEGAVVSVSPDAVAPDLAADR